MFTKVLTAAVLMLPALALAQNRHGGLFQYADPNQDGMITREEFNAARAEQFTKLDRNSDGFIDAADRDGEAARQEHGRRRHGRHTRLDADGDRKVSKEEFVNGPTRFFDQPDTDKSNVLDAKELDAVRAAAKERGRDWRERRTPPAETTTQQLRAQWTSARRTAPTLTPGAEQGGRRSYQLLAMFAPRAASSSRRMDR